MTSSAMVDWDLAVTTGKRLVRPGPQVSPDVARQAVADLKTYAALAHGHVAGFTGLDAPTDPSSVVVIDRPGWIQANAAGFRTVLEPLVEKLQERRTTSSAVGDALGSKVTGVQTGSLLAFLATKVLGQYELFPPYGATGPDAADRPGRLLLVAPNIVSAEREMGVDPRDFRLWVCLHEETHRVQFGAVPWMRDHLMSEIRAFVDATDVDPSALAERVRAAAAAAYGAVRQGFDPDSTDSGSIVEAVQTPAQREILDRVTAMMSLLEGHADFVMDGVGPSVIPSVTDIRAKFQARRKEANKVEQVVRRLLGVDAKLRQYRDGERFVRHAVDKAGMHGFNQVWGRPENLPSKAEIADPAAWVERVVTPRQLPA
jgi:coenzyme F420 biosynthesis associated uncharacterized protein